MDADARIEALINQVLTSPKASPLTKADVMTISRFFFSLLVAKNKVSNFICFLTEIN